MILYLHLATVRRVREGGEARLSAQLHELGVLGERDLAVLHCLLMLLLGHGDVGHEEGHVIGHLDQQAHEAKGQRLDALTSCITLGV